MNTRWSGSRSTASRLVTAAVASPVTVNSNAGLPQIAPGSQVDLSGSSLGDSPGVVTLQIHEMVLPVEILAWTPTGATVRIPTMTLTRTTPALLTMTLPDGTSESVKIVGNAGFAKSQGSGDSGQGSTN